MKPIVEKTHPAGSYCCAESRDRRLNRKAKSWGNGGADMASVVKEIVTRATPAQAWDAIRLIADPDDGPQPTRTTWAWTCDKCSDPACEHRLFSDLVAGRR